MGLIKGDYITDLDFYTRKREPEDQNIITWSKFRVKALTSNLE
jgi:hypothetical protein